MPAEITLNTGPARSGKTTRLVELISAELANAQKTGELGTALWLVPNFRVVDEIRQRLLGPRGRVSPKLATSSPAGFSDASFGETRLRGAVLGLGIRTFDQFAEAILGGAIEAGRPLSQSQKRGLLGEILAELRAAGKLEFFREIADRPSLVETIGRSITELKRRGISPQVLVQRAKRATASSRDREMALVYAEYQRRLDAHKLYDGDSRLALASELVRRGEMGAYADLRLVVVDGLNTFTLAQQAMLAALSERVKRIAIALTYEEDADRAELFATTHGTGVELRALFPELKVEKLNRLEPHAHEDEGMPPDLEQFLFINPRKLKQAASTAQGIEIFAAANQQDEVLQVARRVKRLLSDGVPARDILVTARSLAGLEARIREVFPRFGIPFVTDRMRKLGEEPLVRLLIALLELDGSDWPFRALVRLLTNRCVGAFDRENRRAAAEWIVRDLQYAKGREPLLKAVRKIAGATGSASAEPGTDGTGIASGTPEQSRRSESTKLASPLLTELAAALDDLPVQATPLEWFTAFERIAKRLEIVVENVDAPTALREGLRAAEQVATWQGEPSPVLNREEILALLRDIASHESLPERNDEAGCVRVIGAPTARLLPAKHLFVMGLVEQAFPSPEAVGELYNDRELDALSGVKRTDDETSVRSSAEMLLFYELVCRAKESIAFSYAALDEKAQPQFASPYLQDVKRIFKEGAIQETRPQDSLIPIPSGPPTSDTDWRLQAIDRALDNSPALFAGLLSESRTVTTARALVAGLEATRHRTRGESFGPFEGVFAEGPAGQKLAERFGSKHLWSPSQLERYADCPFRFFMEQVCRLEPPGELLLATDPLRKGTLAHEALALLHRKLRERIEALPTVSHLGAESLRLEFLAALEEARAMLPVEGVAGALTELEMKGIVRWSEPYAQQHDAYDKQWSHWDEPPKPSHFEVRFGPARGKEEYTDERSTDEPFVLVVGGEELRITGRIDRIDVGRLNGQTVLTIVDYKSGSNVRYVTEDVQAGKQLQLVLYALAAQQHLFRGENATTIKAGYWALAEENLETKKIKRWVDFHREAEDKLELDEAWSATWQQTTERIGQIVQGIRRGEFPMYNTNEHCTSTCHFRTVCRVGVARSLEKEWPSGAGSSEQVDEEKETAFE